MYCHAQAPVRIGIAGGGTDLPAWTKERTGYCLSLAINHYTHAVGITRPDRQVVASYRNRDVANAATEIANGLIRETALMHGWEEGFEVHTPSEVSSLGSGLGVSSSIAVALAAMFSRMSRLRRGDLAAEDTDRLTIARGAWTVEIERLLRPIGRQDHMAAAHGGLKLYRFAGTHAFVERVFSEEDAAWVAGHLVVLQLPEGHDSRAILRGATKASPLEAALSAVPLAVNAIEKRDPRLLGAALRSGQVSKEHIPGAVPRWLVEREAAVRGMAGVYGCKVAGAGGGGHLVAACEPGAVQEIALGVELPAIAFEPDFRGVRSEGWL